MLILIVNWRRIMKKQTKIKWTGPKAKVGIDLDGCLLDEQKVWDYVQSLSERDDVELWWVTSRYEDPQSNGLDFDNNDAYEAAENFGVPLDRIVFTNHEWKSTYYKYNFFVLHIDDSMVELLEIREHTNVDGIHVSQDIVTIGNKLIKNWLLSQLV